ncbi:hypothetical protein B0H16DRAFT_1724951 [Mycena metata]|uniref:Uncharacterized protein n=1 Tax=Mycena metata TaxID=1033252 RepID=A0AAD7IUK6_9AGAR|nr:hypothetical protein B0H16DRAFT_1724951 [Mycena metata]
MAAGDSDDVKPDVSKIKIAVEFNDRQLVFQYKKNKPLEKLLIIFCEKINIDRKTVKFEYDGTNVRGEVTAETVSFYIVNNAVPNLTKSFFKLEMEDNDVISGHIFQNAGRFTSLRAHTAPPHLSKEHTENLLKFDVIFQNNRLDNFMRDMGYPEPAITVLLMLECESIDRFTEFMGDTAVQKILLEAKQLGVDGPSPAERNLWLGIFKIPADRSPDEFKRKLGAVLDRVIAEPVGSKNIVKQTVAVGLPAAEPTIVVMTEAETWDGTIEISASAAAKGVISDGIKDLPFHLNSSCYGADVATEI